MGEVGGKEGEGSGGVSGDDNYRMGCSIKLTTLLEKPKRALPHLPVVVKLKDCFLTLRPLFRPFYSTSFCSLMYAHHLFFT